MYYSTQDENIDGLIFLILDQINHGTINDPQLQIKIAQLNYKAASKAMNNSNFAAAYFYSTAAIKLLPPDHWECHYELSRGIFLVQGNAAYTNGCTENATRALDMILLHGRSLKDKLDAYYLKISLVSSLFLCRGVLHLWPLHHRCHNSYLVSINMPPVAWPSTRSRSI